MLVAGIPNVGKSTFINAMRNELAGKSKWRRPSFFCLGKEEESYGGLDFPPPSSI